MFPYPSIKFFRQLLVFSLLVWASIVIIQWTGTDAVTVEETELLRWNYYGAKIPYNLLNIIYWAVNGIHAAGLIAMIFLRGWGRLLVVASIGLDFLTTSFMGMIVSTGVIDMLSIVDYSLVSIPLVLSFFDPCSGYFDKTKNVAEQGAASDR